jgi:hypothetical protein
MHLVAMTVVYTVVQVGVGIPASGVASASGVVAASAMVSASAVIPASGAVAASTVFTITAESGDGGT